MHFTALAAFHDTFDAAIAAVVRRSGPEYLVDEIKQHLLVKLFVGTDRREPQIGRYTGSGSLRAWVCVLAARDTYGELRKRPGERLSETDELAD